MQVGAWKDIAFEYPHLIFNTAMQESHRRFVITYSRYTRH